MAMHDNRHATNIQYTRSIKTMFLKKKLRALILYLRDQFWKICRPRSGKINLKDPKFGVLYASTYNLGDTVQTLAQIELFKKLGITDYILVDRENLSRYSGQHVNLLMGAWYMHKHHRFPPSKKINPICMSIHLQGSRLLQKDCKYFLKYQPIGCRDEATVQLFKDFQVEAYLTKCISLAFDKYDGPRKGVYFVDMRNEISYIPTIGQDFLDSLPIPTKHLTHDSGEFIKASNVRRMLNHTEGLLKLYREAELVVTPRLHCALPCRAFGTPTIFVHPNYRSDKRFTGLYKELQGSDGQTSFDQLDSHIDYNIIREAQESLLSDLKRRVDKINPNKLDAHSL